MLLRWCSHLFAFDGERISGLDKIRRDARKKEGNKKYQRNHSHTNIKCLHFHKEHQQQGEEKNCRPSKYLLAFGVHWETGRYPFTEIFYWLCNGNRRPFLDWTNKCTWMGKRRAENDGLLGIGFDQSQRDLYSSESKIQSMFWRAMVDHGWPLSFVCVASFATRLLSGTFRGFGSLATEMSTSFLEPQLLMSMRSSYF